MPEQQSNVNWYRGFHRFLLSTPEFKEFSGMFGGEQVLQAKNMDLLKLQRLAIGFLHYRLDFDGRQRFFKAIASYAAQCGAAVPDLDKDDHKPLDTLNREGWAQLADIDQKTVDGLLAHFKNNPLLPWGKRAKEQYASAADLRTKTNVASVPDEFLSGRRDVLALGLSSDVLSIAAHHLQAPPILLGVTAWTSFASKDGATRPAVEAQKFHFDLDDYRFVKQFIYLTDVDDGSGPHEYIPKSHLPDTILAARDNCVNKGILSEDEFNEWYFRALRKDDSDVKSYLGIDPIAITGKAGSRLMVNTEGIHKGRVPIVKDRWIVQFLYGVSAHVQIDDKDGLFFSKADFLNLKSELSGYSGQFLNII